ncbi:hypothetical protein FN846DRAFT_892878 [Sphaerosporella brunnea]|uniref:Uncharacterized protein n=1 Tax=Sphaerosporella brunnea TaxID=1250544 RepID=A0A5J5EPC0_9PEZI|nr:hypothetical protein FN846DRAFT_892878 [Sphaerosporella brunnea]
MAIIGIHCFAGKHASDPERPDSIHENVPSPRRNRTACPYGLDCETPYIEGIRSIACTVNQRADQTSTSAGIRDAEFWIRVYASFAVFQVGRAVKVFKEGC